MSTFAVGSLVRARGREWVVLPESEDDLLVLRPLGGSEDEVAGVLTGVERVEPATFALPTPGDVGDYRSARLLRDALRLGFRSSAGPFRSFGKIAVEPRPYQLVPLLMALRLDPVRLLIADDVGIGKTVEALLVARELLEQGDARRLCVLCPPHLAEQWQKEMAAKFHLSAELVLASTAGRLERTVPRGVGESIFERLEVTVVSTDFMKNRQRRDDFVRAAPELVIVDEAHTCVADASERGRSAAHQRYELVSGLAEDPTRHLILVTATPHSGKEGAFRSLLGLLDPAFRGLPENLAGDPNRRARETLARHLVQRLRGDVHNFLGSKTPFPERVSAERTYKLSPEYARLFTDVLAYARETVTDTSGGLRRQRVRWWSALALLRSLASSPKAAEATLLARSAPGEAATVEEADEVGRRTVLDLADEDAEGATDVAPGADAAERPEEREATNEERAARRRLRAFATRAADLAGTGTDTKLAELARVVRRLLDEGHKPIVFCRFIPTANYVADQLRARLGVKGLEVSAVTGEMPGDEREAEVARLTGCSPRVLVATDCLSEGINLQDGFDAVVHYDLAWNPTRHEQREGRVDRFGQPRKEVRVVTIWGEDNGIDRLVIDVLVRKHQAIRADLQISVPVPGAQAVAEALVGGLLLRQGPAHEQLSFDLLPPAAQQVLLDWDEAAREEKRNRGVFAQHGLDVSEVAAELASVRGAIGSGPDVERFVGDVVVAAGGAVKEAKEGLFELSLTSAPLGLRDAVGARPYELTACFDLPEPEGTEYLSRTHPLVEGLGTWALETALDSARKGVASRAGATRTAAISSRTTLFLVRRRYDIELTRAGKRQRLLAEDAAVHAFDGDPSSPSWLDDAEAEALLAATPAGNLSPEQARELVSRVVATEGSWRAQLESRAVAAAAQLARTHRQVREGGRQTGARTSVVAQVPVDVLGVYVLLPLPSVR
jgi:superfamily II DNA or RNA helicase